jgi:hypothetical protein
VSARQYRDRRTMVSMADAVDAAKQAHDVLAALDAERARMDERWIQLRRSAADNQGTEPDGPSGNHDQGDTR